MTRGCVQSQRIYIFGVSKMDISYEKDSFSAPPPHNGPKSLILAPQDIPDISGYQLVFGCQCVKAYINENHVTNQKIL